MRSLSLTMLLVAASAAAAAGSHYAPHEQVTVVANKVGPFQNPTETYQYYSLPFCPRTGGKSHRQELGEILSGDRKTTSPYEVTFLDNAGWRMLCTQVLTPAKAQKFSDAIEENFYFEMFIDGLPLWGYVGEVEGEDLILGHTEATRTYIYPHLHFSLGYNDDRIVSVNVTTEPRRKVDITSSIEDGLDTEVTFSYSVEWIEEPNLTYEHRMTRYVDNKFLPSSFEIHWLSVINSFVLVLLLTAFLTIILMRVLKNDFSRYMDMEEDGDLTEEETGWKLISGDVFRFPDHPNAFCALVGTGCHLSVVTFGLLVLALLGAFKPTRRGSIMTAAIVLYALTSFVGGFVSARLFRQFSGGAGSWVWNIVLTAIAFPGPLFVVFSYVNSIAWNEGSTAALPFTTCLVILALFVLVAFPLTIIGGIAGKHTARDFEAPCRTTKVPRQIPSDIPWYRQLPAQMFMAGFLPFSAIYIELHYIFASVWGHKIYTLFGILFLASIMLFVVSSFITITTTYFQLTKEDYRWWWRSFASGGSTGLFIFAYTFFYFFNRSGMYGVLQSSYYFGYMAIVSYAFFCMLGAVGFFSSLTFVRHIYGSVKCD